MVEFLVKRRRFRIPRVSTASSWSKTEPCILVHAFLLRLRVVFHNDHPRIRVVWKSRVKFRTISLGRSRHAFRTSSIRRLNNERDEIQPSFSSVKKSFSFSLSLSLSFTLPPVLFFPRFFLLFYYPSLSLPFGESRNIINRADFSTLISLFIG